MAIPLFWWNRLEPDCFEFQAGLIVIRDIEREIDSVLAAPR
jgi:hypothetical protein